MAPEFGFSNSSCCCVCCIQRIYVTLCLEIQIQNKIRPVNTKQSKKKYFFREKIPFLFLLNDELFVLVTSSNDWQFEKTDGRQVVEKCYLLELHADGKRPSADTRTRGNSDFQEWQARLLLGRSGCQLICF